MLMVPQLVTCLLLLLLLLLLALCAVGSRSRAG
jgi:hypothetical protein